MPGNPQLLTSTTIPTYREILLFQLQKSTHCVKTFDTMGLSLTTYHWPVQGKRRVTPDRLRNYRESHQFLGPCCLCPLLAPLSEEPTFTEAAIYIPVIGRYQGEYVAECAKSRCGYLVPLERIYPKFGVPVKKYPVRDDQTFCPPPVLHHSEIEARPLRPLKRTYAQADLTDVPHLAGGADLGYQTDWRKFPKLDCMDRPGLKEAEFFGLFVKCDACMLVMTHLVFPDHHCSPQEVDDSELTDQE